MTTTLESAPTQSPEQSKSPELSRPNILKSSEFFNETGDINASVIKVQETMGLEITPEWWAKNVGEANNDLDTAERFDIEFKKEFEAREWRNNGVPEERIAAIQGHEDYNADPDSPDTPQQINGINIPAEIANDDEVDPNQWAAEEAKRRENYIFYRAEFHLNLEFEIAGELYVVDGIHYTGTDGEYETLAVDVKKVGSDDLEQYVTIDRLEQMIKSDEADFKNLETTDNDTEDAGESDTKDNSDAEERFERSNDDPDALPRAALELFVRQHEDETNPPAAPAQDSETDESGTIEALDNTKYITELKNADLDDERQKAIDEFNKKIGDQEILDQFMTDLDNYLDSQRALQQQILDREENARQDAYDLAT